MLNLFKNYSETDCMAGVDIGKFFTNYQNFEAELLVLWYGRLFQTSSGKLIEVYFLDCTTNKQHIVGIPIEIILRLPIGSIWRNGKSYRKYDFDSMNIRIDAINEKNTRNNLSYTNHYANFKARGYQCIDKDYILKPNSYPVKNIEKDGNTHLVVNNNIVIPSVLFFLAHYGVSKEINRVLVSYHMQEAERRLEMNDGNNELITIPSRCVIGDATFLYHLKTDRHTQDVVASLNHRMLKINRDKHPIKVEPYHAQAIDLKIKGMRVDSNTILCTEILGISMPKGEPITYRIDKSNSATYGENGEPETIEFTPLYNSIESEEIILEAERNPNNITTAIVRQRIEPIGEIRELIKNGIMNLGEALMNCSSARIAIPREEPLVFGFGENGNAGGDVGVLQVLADGRLINPVENNFERLLRYAQSLKVSINYAPVIIDCVNLSRDDIFIGEQVVAMHNNQQHNTKVNSVFVLRLITKIGIFYVFDCDKQGSQTQGFAIKTIDESDFIENKIKKVVREVFKEDGRFSAKLNLNYQHEINYFKHTNGENSNWIKTLLNKFNN